jgi:hypothetical protein
MRSVFAWIGNVATTREKFLEAVVPVLSTTWMLSVNNPVCVGVPLRSPPVLSVRPVGIVGTDQVYGDTPPVALNW